MRKNKLKLLRMSALHIGMHVKIRLRLRSFQFAVLLGASLLIWAHAGQAISQNSPPTKPVEARIRQLLKDPESARFEWKSAKWLGTEVSQEFLQNPRMLWSCTRVNARNSYGGYGGPKFYMVRISPQTSAILHLDSEDDQITGSFVRRMCSSHGY